MQTGCVGGGGAPATGGGGGGGGGRDQDVDRPVRVNVRGAKLMTSTRRRGVRRTGRRLQDLRMAGKTVEGEFLGSRH